MKIKNNIEIYIEREEGLRLLKVWESTNMGGMKLYCSFNDYIRAGKKLRPLKEKNLPFIIMSIKEFQALSVNIITNVNLINIKKVMSSEKNDSP